MFDFLEQLRNKPTPQRKIIVFATSLFLTAIIFLLWMSVFTRTVLHTKTNEISYERTRDRATASPVLSERDKTETTLFSIIGELYIGIKQTITDATESDNLFYTADKELLRND